jgi:hypothetical protein
MTSLAGSVILAGGILPFIAKGVECVASALFKKYQLSGMVISPKGGKTYLLTHISSPDTLWVDLDPEIFNSLDSEEKQSAVSHNSNLNINRVVYLKGKDVFEELMEMINGTSRSIKKICFLSRDYRLLKFVGINNIIYTLGSTAYYDNLANIDDETKKSILAYKEELLKNKGDKLFIYTNLVELIDLVIDRYNASLKV